MNNDAYVTSGTGSSANLAQSDPEDHGLNPTPEGDAPDQVTPVEGTPKPTPRGIKTSKKESQNEPSTLTKLPLVNSLVKRLSKSPLTSDKVEDPAVPKSTSDKAADVESKPTSDNEAVAPVGAKASVRHWLQQSVKRPMAVVRSISKDTDKDVTMGMCGALGRYPSFLQRFATPRVFLLAYCFQNVLQGTAGAVFIGTITSIERHFHFSSRTWGSILMFSEIGPIFSSLILSQLGGRGNRPRWMAGGQLLSMLGLMLAFANNFFYPPADISEMSELIDSKKLCDFRDLLSEQVLPLDSKAAPLRSFNPEKCFSHNQSAFFSWLLAHTFIGVGNSLVYSVGAPYLDDSIQKKNSPIYFAISLAVRILGPLIGFSLTAALLKVYVRPNVDPGIDSSDPRWIGAWWVPCLWLALMFLLCAIFTSLFPRKMKPGPKAEEDGEKNGTVTLEDVDLTNGKTKKEPVEGGAEEGAEEKPLKVPIMEQAKALLETVKRLLRNKVILYGFIGDFFGMSAIFSIYMWLPKYYEHHFRVSKSASALATGITGVSSLVIGILGGGLFVQRVRPSAKTITMIVIICKTIQLITFTGLMNIDCGFNDDLPGVLTPDEQSIELYRGCSGGCECDTKEFIPVCITDGPMQVTFFSPCHAGCYIPEDAPVSSIAAVGATGLEVPTLVTEGVKTYRNCSCGSTDAVVTSGYCHKTCSGFIWFNVLHVTVNSFVAFGAIGGMLISLRCVSEEDKAPSLGLKSTMMSLAMLINPVVFGSLFDTTCLLWEEACGETGACWVYDTLDYGRKMFISAIILFLISVIFECFVYRHVKHVKLFDDEDEQPETRSALSKILGSKHGGENEGKAPSRLSETFNRISKSTNRIFRSTQNKEGDPKTDVSSTSESTNSNSESQASTVAEDSKVSSNT